MEGVMGRGVEYSTIGARPLVRVYSPKEMRRHLEATGLEDVRAAVRHFKASDTPVTAALEQRVTALRRPETLDRIGRVGGWYIVAGGRRPR